MKLNSEGWVKHLKQNPLPVYLLDSNEELLLDEAINELNQFLRAHDFQERHRFQANSSLNVTELEEAAQNFSLFAHKKRIELHCGEKMPAEIAQWISRFCEQIQYHQDICLIIKSPKLSLQDKKAKWVAAVEKTGGLLTLHEVSLADFPLWLDRRLFQARLKLDQAARGALIAATEGNLFAATQVMSKLALLPNSAPITLAEITPLLGDNANYDLFDLSRQVLLANVRASLRILAQLQIRSEPVLVLWVLTKELKLLLKLHAQQHRAAFSDLCRSLQIWGPRQKEFAAALGRMKPEQIAALLALCSKIDFSIKGLTPEDPWSLIRQLVVRGCARR